MKLHDDKEQADKNLPKKYYGSMYVSTEKMYNVEVEIYVLLGGQNWGLQTGRRLLR